MVCKFFNLKSRRIISVFLMGVVMLLTFIPSVFADPDTSSDVPGDGSEFGWIDLTASVPDDFSGSVFVQVWNVDEDSYHDIECFVLNDFKNSTQVPVGNYEVVAVNTSENPFLYYATCDVEEFELTNSYSLNVIVEKVSDSETVLAESIEGQEEISDPEDEGETDGRGPENLDAAVEEVEDGGSGKTSEDETSQGSKEEKSGKSPYSLLISFLFSLLLIVIAAFVLWKMKNN